MRIVVAVDGSTWGFSAARVALQLAESVPLARLTALHVVPVRAASGNLIGDLAGRLGLSDMAVADVADVAEELQAGKAILSQLSELAQSRGVDLQVILEQGGVVTTLIKHARHADLFVMGLHGETEDAHPGEGGRHVAEVLDGISTPLLLVSKSTTSITGIALGYDSSRASAHALTSVRRLVDGLHCPIHAIHVGGGDTDVLGEVDAQLPGDTVLHYTVPGDDPHLTLVETAEKCGAEVLALGFRGDNSLKNFLFGSTTEYIMAHTELSLLIAH